MGRLTAVELRKMVDTRAGFWLQLAVVALTVIVVGAIDIWGHAADQTLAQMLSAALAPASVLLPVVGILLVSSEWSQRTAPITFALVPQRGRILAAKIAASVVLSIVAFAFCLAVAAVGTAIAAPGLDDTWSLSAGLLGQSALSLATGMITGIAFGAALLSSAPAIVLSFVLPLGWAAVGSIHALEPAARWLDGTRSLSPLTEHLLSGTEWARAGTTLAVWMVLPLVIGLWRILRDEVA
jgi:ABC-type transport system involved in multi-copper enzyme maturation permease subunit